MRPRQQTSPNDPFARNRRKTGPDETGTNAVLVRFGLVALAVLVIGIACAVMFGGEEPVDEDFDNEALQEPFFLLSKAYSYYETDNAKAAAYFRKAAEKGEPEAMYRLAGLYAAGDGLPHDNEQALNWYLKAAGLGDVEAQKDLASLYALGLGTPKNWAEAERWLCAAAEQGDAEAMCRLGDLYAAGGDGLKQDMVQALAWYRKAAEQGSRTAKCRIGVMLFQGDGVPEDRAKALELFREAAREGEPTAQFNLGIIHYNGYGVDKDIHEAARWFEKAANGRHQMARAAMQRQDIATAHQENLKAEEEARYRAIVEPLMQRARKGEAKAQFGLGAAYYYGMYGLPRDKAQAALWYGKAAEQNHPKALRNLPKMYDEGDGIPQDRAQAAFWYRKAAEYNIPGSRKILAERYYAGDGIPRDTKQAVHWYRLLAEESEDPGISGMYLRKIGKIYAEGDGMPRNEKQAVALLSEAALLGDEESPLLLARLYAAGKGLPPDKGRAILWLHWAASDFNRKAMLELERIYAEGDGVPRNTWLATAWCREVCERSDRQCTQARDMLHTLDAEAAIPKKYEHAMSRLLWMRMALAKSELLQACGKTSKTEQGKIRIARIATRLESDISTVINDLTRLKEGKDELPPQLKALIEADSARAAEICRELAFVLGRLAAEGDGMERDPGLSLYYYRRSLKLGNSKARAVLQHHLPDIASAPDGKKAAGPGKNGKAEQPAQGPAGAEAQRLLAKGRACWIGDGVPQNRTQAVSWFRKALEQGSAEAARILARCSFFGEGTEESDAETLYCLLMYKALRDTDGPLPEAEQALKRCCEIQLPNAVIQDVRQRWLKDLADIRLRMTAG